MTEWRPCRAGCTAQAVRSGYSTALCIQHGVAFAQKTPAAAYSNWYSIVPYGPPLTKSSARRGRTGHVDVARGLRPACHPNRALQGCPPRPPGEGVEERGPVAGPGREKGRPSSDPTAAPQWLHRRTRASVVAGRSRSAMGGRRAFLSRPALELEVHGCRRARNRPRARADPALAAPPQRRAPGPRRGRSACVPPQLEAPPRPEIKGPPCRAFAGGEGVPPP
jgi:hypothetical protein